MTRMTIALITPFLLAGPLPSAAAPCAGFEDVSSTSDFCPSVEWLRNRRITLGCGANAYCSDNPVTRLAMAAFMQRLAVALTPIEVGPIVTAAAPVALSGGVRVCETPDIVVANYPVRSYVSALATLSMPTGPGVDVKSEVVYSINAGPWTAVQYSDQYTTLYGGASPAQEVSIAPYAVLELAANDTVRFALRLSRKAGTGDATAACAARVQIVNRNGITSPY